MGTAAPRRMSVSQSACLLIGISGFLSMLWDIARWGHETVKIYDKGTITSGTALFVFELFIAWRGTSFAYKNYFFAAMLLAVGYETYRMWVEQPLPHTFMSLSLGALWVVTALLFSNFTVEPLPEPTTQ